MLNKQKNILEENGQLNRLDSATPLEDTKFNKTKKSVRGCVPFFYGRQVLSHHCATPAPHKLETPMVCLCQTNKAFLQVSGSYGNVNELINTIIQ